MLVAYDGSDDARRALEVASALLETRRALVLHVYQPFVELLMGGDLELPKAIAAEAAETARTDREEAEAVSAEGAEVARAAGFEPTGLVAEGSMSVWPTIVEVADEHDACAVVMGSRGLSGVSRVLGSVSNGVVHHCERPVVVVPPAAD